MLQDYTSFAECFDNVPTSETAAVFRLYECLDRRYTLYLSEDTSNYRVDVLSAQRDSFRESLLDVSTHWKNRRVITSKNSHENVLVSILGGVSTNISLTSFVGMA